MLVCLINDEPQSSVLGCSGLFLGSAIFACLRSQGGEGRPRGRSVPHQLSKFNWGCLEEEQASSKKSRLSASLYIS